jgi:MFS family permease
LQKKSGHGKQPTRSDRDAGVYFSPLYSWYVVFVLMLALMVAYIDRQILSLLVEPIKRDLDVSDTQIGLLAGFAFALFYTVLGVPIARLADTRNRQKIIAAGIFVWSVMTAFCGLAKTYSLLFLARVGVGVGEAALSPSAYSMMADYFPPDKLARAIGVYVMGLYLGTGLAMLGGATIVAITMDITSVTVPMLGTLFSWQLAFLIAAIPGLFVLALLATVREPTRKNYALDGTSSLAETRSIPWSEIFAFIRSQRRYFFLLCAGGGLVGTIITAYLVWVPEFLRRTYGMNIVDAGLLFGIILIVFGMPGTYAGGWLAGWFYRRGRRDAEMRAAMYATAAILPFCLLVPLAPNSTIALLLTGPLIFCLSMPQGLAPAMVQLTSPNQMRAQITAMFTLLAVLTGYTAGGALVAMITDYVFQDESKLNYALAIVGGTFIPTGVLCFRLGLKPYEDARAYVRSETRSA